MKKQQKEQSKPGGEIARARYQQFLKKPERMAGLDEEERELAIESLNDLIRIETEACKLFTEEYSRCLENKQDPTQARGEACKRAYRMAAIHKLECLLRYGTTERLALYAADN